MGDGEHGPDLVPRLCHIVRWPDFNGYGFNLHAEKGKAGQFIGKVDEGSPAEAAGLKAGDRIVEVNGTNIGNENHQQVVGRIKAGGDETRLLVVDLETDQHYKEDKRVVRGDLPEVKFLTAARDDIEQPQGGDYTFSSTTIQDAAPNGGTDPEPEPEPMTTTMTTTTTVTEDNSSQFAPRLCNLVKWADFDGYGFNLHAEKDKPGQYIGLVDPNSPAELGGLREGDRIVEVNGDNVEKQTHVTVIQKIKGGGDRTSMLVVDRATDEHFKARGQTVCSSMTSVVVISTPARSTDTAEEVTAVVSQQVESAPVAEEPLSLNGAEEEVAAGMAAVSVTQQVVETQEEEVVGGGGEVDFNAYEEVDVTAPASTTTTTTTILSYQDDLGAASNGINGGGVDEQQRSFEAAGVVKASEPEPTPVLTTSSSSTPSGDLNLNLSAAEMKERLKARKKQDPRQSKTSFESKYKMFEKM